MTAFDVDIDPGQATAPYRPKHRRPHRWRLPRWMSRRPVAAWTVAGLAAIGVVFTGVQHHAFNASEPVEELLAVIAQRDESAYRSLLAASPYLTQPQKSALAASPVLEKGGLKSPRYSPPTHMRVTSVSRETPRGLEPRDGHEVAEVVVAYRLGDKDYHDSVVVYREKSAWFDDWRLATAGAAAYVDAWHTTSGRYRIGAVSSTDASGFPTPPGTYVITAAGDGIFDPATTRRRIGFDSDIHVDFRTEARAHLKRDIANRIEEWLRRHCTRGRVASTCGFTGAGGEPAPGQVPDTARWRITDYPTISFQERYDAFDEIGPLVVRTASPGAATTTFSTAEGATTTLTVDVYARGHLTATEAGATWHPTSCDIGTPHCPDVAPNHTN